MVASASWVRNLISSHTMEQTLQTTTDIYTVNEVGATIWVRCENHPHHWEDNHAS